MPAPPRVPQKARKRAPARTAVPQRRALQPAGEKANPSRVMDVVALEDAVGRSEDQGVAHSLVDLEDQQRADALFGQLHLLRERGGGARLAELATVAVQISHHIARLVDREHVAGLDSLACAAV